ncbi:DUF5719 family protein [Microbacterium suwonense]|uniref:Large extracellular alpha-helical protein n=1 Tax=Microbacterium suwonense TaxID=683047 RepID=A0ABM8FTE0_9MICO|nr:DUF5719 family protein [Microbacterium suwonense]BDZ38761.1 hypothetical protein GCM10025863_13750 [Microbacterium suwonense]
MKQRTVRLATTGARIATGAVLAAACVAGAVASVPAPWPEVRNSPAVTIVTPVPRDVVLVCNGAFRVLGRDATQAGLMVSAAPLRLRVDGAEDETTTAPLEMPDVTGGEGAQAIVGAVQNRSVPQIAAAESVQLSDEDAAGFAAAPCREPSLTSWLVGGDVSTGASDIIILSNPGEVTATVDLDVYGDERSASTVVVPAKTQLGVPLASVAAGSRSPVVRVVSTGAPVRAALQSTLVRTLDPVGIDLQDGVSGPQKTQVILGARATPATEGDDAVGIVVRMLAPDADAQATVQVRSAASGESIDEYPIELTAATPAEISLAGLAEGAYDIEVSSTAPVVVGARQTVRAGAEEDLAWSLPSPELTADARTTFSVPSGAPATLYLRNPQPEAITVRLEGADEQVVQVDAGGIAAVALRAGGHTLTASGSVNAAIGMRGGDGSAAIAGWPLWPGAATQQPIVVRP